MKTSLPIRLLTAVPICDGHDSAISTVNLELIRHGIEVVYLGYHRSARDIARAAVQEDVRAVGISSYNGGHVEFFSDVIKELRHRGGADIGLFGGGGGTITRADAQQMQKAGVDRIFFAGSALDEMVAFVTEKYGEAQGKRPAKSSIKQEPPDRRLARMLTLAGIGAARATQSRKGNGRLLEARNPVRRSLRRPRLVIGITGPGGAGKTTLIDELVLRFLRDNPASRIAILSHDPSIVGNGALLGDRAAMFYCQDDRLFMRSLSTSGQAGGLAPQTQKSLELICAEDFDVVLIETVGIGQEAIPFGKELVDKTVLVMSPDYGSRLQLQKIAMLDVADVVVVNKSDLAAARAATTEIEHRLALNDRGQRILSTTAKRHGDEGVDQLFELLSAKAERAVVRNKVARAPRASRP